MSEEGKILALLYVLSHLMYSNSCLTRLWGEMFYVVKILGIQFAYIISRGQKVKGFPHFTELALLTNSLCRQVVFAFWETWYILNNINTFGNWRHQRNSKFARILFCLFKKKEWYLETKNVVFCNMLVWFEHHFPVREFANGSKNCLFRCASIS